MLQILPIAFAQVKARNAFVNLLNEIQVVYSLYTVKEVIKKVSKNIINSIQI